VTGNIISAQETTARTAYSRTERNADGTYTATFSVRPMHWQDAQTGEWKEFVNDLRPSTDPAYAYENTANGYRARFGKAPDVAQGRPVVRIGTEGAAITLVAVGASPQDARTSGAQLTYANAYPGADLRYIVDNERVKEEIVLTGAPAMVAAATYTFDLSLEGLAATKRADGVIEFKDASGKLIATMPAPFMMDSNGQSPERAYSPAVTVTLTALGGGKLRLTLAPDLQWLQDPARVYPVVIDPTTEWVTYSPTGAAAQNTTIWQAVPDTNSASYMTLSVGKNTSSQRRDTLIQFPDLTSLPQDSTIVRAYVDLYSDTGTNGLPIEMYYNTGAWNDETVTWNTAPGMAAQVWRNSVTATVPGWNRFWMSALVRAWVQGQLPNHGLRMWSTGTADQTVKFYSSHATSNQPRLKVLYVPASRLGFSALWQYTSYDHGGGTTSYVNVSTGNHVVTHQGGAIATRGFAVDLTHTYNSQDPYGQTSSYDRVGAFYGEGWTFSQNLRLYERFDGMAVVFKDGSGGATRVYASNESDTGTTRNYYRPLYYNMSLTKNLSSTADPARVYTLTPDSGGQVMSFDGGGKVRRIEDRNGNVLSYSYDTDSTTIADPNGRLTTITDVAGRKTLLEYTGPSGRLSKITDMAGRVSTYGYDGYGNLTTITQGVGTADEVTTALSYSAGNLLQNITNPRGHTSQRFTYYRNSWKPTDSGTGSTEGWAANANTTISQSTERAFHGSAALKLSVSNITNTSAGGASRSYTTPDTWNSIQQDLLSWVYVPSGVQLQGRLVLTDAVGQTQAGPTTLINGGVWTAVSLPAAHIDPAYKVQKLSFEITTPAGAAAYTGAVWLDFLLVRGLTSRLTDATPAHNLIGWHKYNWTTKQTQVAQPDTGGTLRDTTYTYDRSGLTTATTDPLGNTTKTGYDTDLRPTTVQEVDGATSRLDYYPSSNQLQTATNPVNETQRQGVDTTTGDTRYTLDERNEQLRANGLGFVATVFVRDSAGNVTTLQTNRYAAGTNLESTPLPVPLTTLREMKLTYGVGGVMTSMTDPNGNTTYFTYDNGTGYLAKIDMPAGNGETSHRVASITYNTDGTISQTIDPKGQTTTYEYDGLGRQTKINYGVGTPEAFSVTYTLDQNGKMIAMSDRAGSSSWTYDENNQCTSETRTQNRITKTARYTYFANGLLSSKTSLNGETVTFSYDAALRLVSQTDPKDGGRAILYGYDLLARSMSITFPSGVTQRVIHDQAGRIDLQTLQKSDGTLLQRFDYDYGIDATGNRSPSYWNGNVLSVTELDGSKVTYSYDELDRLASAVRTGSGSFNQAFAYDKNNNRSRVTERMPDGTSATTEATYDAANQLVSYGSTIYAYDRNGNQVSVNVDRLAYDAANRWTSGTVGNQDVTFSYDGLGRRVTNFVSGARTDFWYDDTGLALETGAANASYLRNSNGSLLSVNSGGTTYNYGRDRQGSITALVAPDGALANTYTYTPYGDLQAASGTAYNPFQFTGAYHDSGGYYQMGARYYHSSTGRFTQLDPLPSSTYTFNRYAYAEADPANFTDPTGYYSTRCGWWVGLLSWRGGYACRVWFSLAETRSMASHMTSWGEFYGWTSGLATGVATIWKSFAWINPYAAAVFIVGALYWGLGKSMSLAASRGGKAGVHCQVWPSFGSCFAFYY
jgi:RHS repeat-associated protein